MLGLKKRKESEGWAIDVDKAEPDGRDGSLRQRFADSDKLWAGSLIAVVVVVFGMYAAIKFAKPLQPRNARPSMSADALDYTNAAHQKFARKIVARKVGDIAGNTLIIDAEFIGKDKFRIVVRGEISADEIDAVSTMTARKIEHDFGVRPVVQVYRRRASDGRDEVVGSARWRPDKYGYFFKFENVKAGIQ